MGPQNDDWTVRCRIQFAVFDILPYCIFDCMGRSLALVMAACDLSAMVVI